MKLFGISLFKEKQESLEILYKDLKRIQKEINQSSRENLETLKKIQLAKKDLSDRQKSVELLKKELSEGNPYLARIIADFYHYRDIKVAEYLRSKKYPAIKASEKVKDYASENRELRRKFKLTYNRIKLYEEVFPFISDLEPDDIDFILEQKKKKSKISDNDDPVREYVPEYDKLTEEERNQRALNRYLKSKKSNWEVGKMYERYVGSLYESKGYKVEYVGIEKGFDDLGRDLICRNAKETLVIQCKYWASHKEIREAHINQLYGTTVKHFIDEFKNRSEILKNTLFPELLARDEVKIKPVFFTSTKLSKTAEDFAIALGIQIIQEHPFDQNYPMIKCNLNSQTGEKIYHLPIDQQYDNVLMQNEERIYVRTVKEAMELGCRRAYRWNPNK
ncbi:restriction endonuclease [Gilvibacter sediminis]|uniref:restriction endonuclease n=1 Tax=Gilvibacter sediminis TaxID=379071 RepID=UPI00235044E7|nr:restriction endonuclease [Gilvibacter sediminis]MDC7997976.1 restriction endonuclease [Gilvibacter sediminis]